VHISKASAVDHNCIKDTYKNVNFYYRKSACKNSSSSSSSSTSSSSGGSGSGSSNSSSSGSGGGRSTY